MKVYGTIRVFKEEKAIVGTHIKRVDKFDEVTKKANDLETKTQKDLSEAETKLLAETQDKFDEVVESLDKS